MILNYIDLVLVGLVLLTVWHGWRRGLILGLLDLVGWIGSLLLALALYEPVTHWVTGRLAWSEIWIGPLVFLILIIAGGLLVALVGAALLRRLPAEIHEQPSNRLLGMGPGLVNGLIVAAVVAALVLAVPLPGSIRVAARDSALASPLAPYAGRFETMLTPVFDDVIADTLASIAVEPPEGEAIQLPYAVIETEPRPELEVEMLALTNRERVAAGLPPLENDPALTEVARQHSADMLKHGYFAHIDPDGQSPFDRIRAAGLDYLVAGENLALAPSVVMAHAGLMKSPGHRANILRPEFGRVGIGIMDGGPLGLMITQTFRN